MKQEKNNLDQSQIKFRRKILNPFWFYFFTFFDVPMGWIANMKLKELSFNHCVTSVPFHWYYRWQNKNPFKSMYFAVQSMAAELSTASIALLATHNIKPSIAYIIVEMKAIYIKKATGSTTFNCNNGDEIFAAVEKCIKEKKGTKARVKTIGKLKDGTIVSEFYFTWSFKQRS